MVQGVEDIRMIAEGVMAIRHECDMLLRAIQPHLQPEKPPACEHRRKKLAPGSTMGHARYICEDCGAELEVTNE